MQVTAKKSRAPWKPETQPDVAQSFTFPAPIRGWILNENLATIEPGGARVLDNWICTTTGIRARGGALLFATLDNDAVSLFDYNATVDAFFGATDNGIFDITAPSSPTVPVVAGVVGLTSGAWSTVQFGTAGGDFLYAVNGVDIAELYNGTTWNPVNAAAVNQVAFDAQTTAFTVGATLTGGTSGATATILSVQKLTATTGVLKLGAITAGPYQDNETITGGGGSALANGASAAASSTAITGVLTSDLSHVWSFGSRLFFVKKNTMQAWYLPVDSIGGAAVAFSLAGIFSKGGSLLFGAKWSMDAGDGLDDKCVFVSTEGEVAIYEGTNPGSAADWRKAGVYVMPKPLGKKAYTTAGGDLLIATEVGLIPISAAIQSDLAAIESKAVSRNISPHWRLQASVLTQGWEIVKTPRRGCMFVSQPGDTTCLAVNLLTGAWSRVTGWSALCMGYFGSAGYFGTATGAICQMESGGSDNGEIYTATYLGQHDAMDAPGRQKTVLQMRAMFQVGSPIDPQLTALGNFDEELPVPPSSPAAYAVDGWDVGLWDVVLWDAGTTITSRADWSPAGVTGYTIAPALQLTFGVTPTPVVELVAIDAEFRVGAMVA